MEPLLAFAGELERSDADVARRLAVVGARRAEVDAVRSLARASAQTLDALPGRRAARSRDEHAARAARAAAVSALREAQEQEAEYGAAEARASIDAADRWLATLEERREQLEDDEREAREQGRTAAERARALGAAFAEPPGLDEISEWASRERGALLLEHSGLAREREALVREASELLGSVLGEPFAATSVAGLRERLERA